MADDGTPLRELFISLADRPFVFVRPGGNWGDHLIYFGAEHLAAQLGVSWRTVEFADFRPAEVPAEAVVYIHGGGGYNRWSSGNGPKSLRLGLQSAAKVVIQGPCTLEGAGSLDFVAGDVARSAAEQVYFFAREHESFRICQAEMPGSVPYFLNQDTALYLDRDSLLSRIDPVRPRIDLVAVREDVEAIPTGGRVDWRAPVVDPATYALSFAHWLRIHAVARTILTNRTHSSICGAILGTPTTLFSGSYHKNRSIWEFSLERLGVRWLDSAEAVPPLPEIDPMLAWMPCNRARRSWRLDRLAKRLRGIPAA